MIKNVKELKISDVLDLGGSVCTLINCKVLTNSYELTLKNEMTGEQFEKVFNKNDNVVVW